MATIASLVDDIRPMIAAEVPEKAMIDAYRWSCREFMRKSRWLRETITVNVLDTVDTYALTAVTTDTEAFAIQAAQFEGDYLTPATHEEVKSGTEGWYLFVPPATIQLAWTPDADSTGGLLVRVYLNLTIAATTIPDAVVTQWNADISYGAISRLLAMTNTAWYNSAESARYYQMYVDGLLMARLEAEKQAKAYAYGSVQG